MTRATLLAGVLATVVLNLDPVRELLPDQQVQTLLTLGSAAITACAVVLACSIAKFDEGHATAGVAAAIGLYGLVVMPATVVAFNGGTAAHLMAVVRFVGCTVFLVLMGAALLRRRVPLTTGWPAALVGAALTVVLSLLIVGIEPLDRLLTGTMIPSTVVLVGWFLLAACYFVRGVVRWTRETYRIGIGLAVIAAAQLIRMFGTDLVLSASIRLLGTFLLFMALSVRLQQLMGEVAERSAERDHEMNNVLAGLDGMTHVLGHAGEAERELLNEALREEITRLRGLLDRRRVDLPSCAVEPVLSRLVAMRRSQGVDIKLDVQPNLRAAIPESSLAQVVTNLLANCQRHAPGASVQVDARVTEGRVHIDVADDGPGLPEELRDKVLQRGVHDPAAGGSGLGLYVSSQLVAEAGGSLELVPTDAGCRARVQVPS